MRTSVPFWKRPSTWGVGAFIVAMVALFIVGGILGGGDEDDGVAIPDLVGEKGDVAQTALEDLGFKVELDGGEHSVWMASNWTVESTDPAAGEKASYGSQVTVHLHKPADEPDPEPTESATETPAPESSPTPTETATAEPSPTPAPAPELGTQENPFTVENNPDWAALMSGQHDEDWDLIKKFATEHQGQVVAFDANIQHMAPHEGATTRYDLLVGAGDYVDQDTVSGPQMKIEDVAPMSDLYLSGDNIPDTIGVGQNIYLIATIDEYREMQSLLMLDPVETRIR